MLRRATISCATRRAAWPVAATAAPAAYAGFNQFRFVATMPPPAPGKFNDPDMTHFRATPTKHPLLQKVSVEPAAAAPAKPTESAQGKSVPVPPGEWHNPMQNSIWTKEDVEGVQQTHKPTGDMVDRIAYLGVKTLRLGFDIVSGYIFGNITPSKMLRRILFLETAAGIPGMVAGTLRHLASLRRMKRDHGWIHTLLEEAENERMHMLIYQREYKPGLVFRAAVLVTQGIFWNVFFIAYLLSPRLCHRFVGYLEEEAVHTYTTILKYLDSDKPEHAHLKAWGQRPASEIGIRYWRLAPDATMRDMVLATRRDEATHRDVNHMFAGMQGHETNPHVAQAGAHKK